MAQTYKPISPAEMEEACRVLSKACPVMRKVIRRVGPCALAPRRHRAPYESLVRAVANQQLNGKAAQTILDRFCALTPNERFPPPAAVTRMRNEKLRGVGFSNAKVLAIKDIAAKAASGYVPTSRELSRMADDAIVLRLVELRGVGRWTVEMMLIFQLGRPDVLPIDDFGVRRGFQLATGATEMPTAKELGAFGERWRPFRTIAAWYMWRATEIYAPVTRR